MNNQVLNDIAAYAKNRMLQEYGYAGVAQGEMLTCINATDNEGNDIEVKIVVKPLAQVCTLASHQEMAEESLQAQSLETPPKATSNTIWDKTVESLRTEGYCVIIWTPDEIGNAEASILESIVIERGNDFLDEHRYNQDAYNEVYAYQVPGIEG